MTRERIKISYTLPAAAALLTALLVFGGCSSKQPDRAADAEKERAAAPALEAPKVAEAPKEAPTEAPKEAAKAPVKTAPVATNRNLLMNPSANKETAPATYKVKFATTKGDFVVTVNRSLAPLGADRFYNLIKAGYYNDAKFFRVVPGFVVQFGLAADPKVTQVWQNTNLKDDAVKSSNKKGSLTFATAGPNTRTTQVFINLGNNAGLDSQGFAPFGEITEGMNVVEQLYSGYGEGATNLQGQIAAKGNAFLSQSFPNLDGIKTATIM
jgi:peptidyl-prolyl cis-trans isomerase A (cyclophilin A)